WSYHNSLAQAADRAHVAGNVDAATVLRRGLDTQPGVSPLDALAAQHQVASMLAGWEWHTVRAAREHGASWREIADATGADPAQARAEFLAAVDRQAHAAREGWLRFDDADAYRAAAGNWYEQLRADTPPEVVEQIDGARARDDLDALDRLQQVWWDPDRRPPGTGDADRGHTVEGAAPAGRADIHGRDVVRGDDDPIPFVVTGPDRDLHEGRATARDVDEDWLAGDDAYRWTAQPLVEVARDERGMTGAAEPALTAGETRSAEDAARWLARDGRSLDDARAQVRIYQDDVSHRLGTPVHSWGLDDADLADLDRRPTGIPAPRVPVPRAAVADDALIDERLRWTSARDEQPADALDGGSS
ncbi:MAG: hypothetical protein L0K86_25260, partial [Actinomycetia bacterium]|nr:hypothetical protein [Actinomycetes bacterium]